MRLSIPVADLSFLCKSLICGVQDSLLSIVSPKNLVDDTFNSVEWYPDLNFTLR